MGEPQGTLSLTFISPTGERFTYAMGVDAFDAYKIQNVSPPSSVDLEFGLMSMEQVVERMRVREFRKDQFNAACQRLGILLAERMEDKEGWHGVDRQEGIAKHQPDFGTWRG